MRSRADLRARLAAQHGRARGIWLVWGKNAAGDRYLPYDEIVRECLAFGWVDPLIRARDATPSML